MHASRSSSNRSHRFLTSRWGGVRFPSSESTVSSDRPSCIYPKVRSRSTSNRQWSFSPSTVRVRPRTAIGQLENINRVAQMPGEMPVPTWKAQEGPALSTGDRAKGFFEDGARSPPRKVEDWKRSLEYDVSPTSQQKVRITKSECPPVPTSGNSPAFDGDGCTAMGEQIRHHNVPQAECCASEAGEGVGKLPQSLTNNVDIPRVTPETRPGLACQQHAPSHIPITPANTLVSPQFSVLSMATLLLQTPPLLLPKRRVLSDVTGVQSCLLDQESTRKHHAPIRHARSCSHYRKQSPPASGYEVEAKLHNCELHTGLGQAPQIFTDSGHLNRSPCIAVTSSDPGFNNIIRRPENNTAGAVTSPDPSRKKKCPRADHKIHKSIHPESPRQQSGTSKHRKGRGSSHKSASVRLAKAAQKTGASGCVKSPAKVRVKKRRSHWSARPARGTDSGATLSPEEFYNPLMSTRQHQNSPWSLSPIQCNDLPKQQQQQQRQQQSEHQLSLLQQQQKQFQDLLQQQQLCQKKYQEQQLLQQQHFVKQLLERLGQMTLPTQAALSHDAQTQREAERGEFNCDKGAEKNKEQSSNKLRSIGLGCNVHNDKMGNDVYRSTKKSNIDQRKIVNTNVDSRNSVNSIGSPENTDQDNRVPSNNAHRKNVRIITDHSYGGRSITNHHYNGQGYGKRRENSPEPASINIYRQFSPEMVDRRREVCCNPSRVSEPDVEQSSSIRECLSPASCQPLNVHTLQALMKPLMTNHRRQQQLQQEAIDRPDPLAISEEGIVDQLASLQSGVAGVAGDYPQLQYYKEQEQLQQEKVLRLLLQQQQQQQHYHEQRQQQHRLQQQRQKQPAVGAYGSVAVGVRDEAATGMGDDSKTGVKDNVTPDGHQQTTDASTSGTQGDFQRYSSPLVKLFRDQDDYLRKLKEVRERFEMSIRALSKERRCVSSGPTASPAVSRPPNCQESGSADSVWQARSVSKDTEVTKVAPRDA
ncbi:uncharacterized protein LOC101849901 [Aplysia californica]|uniref:Uncharacterized protein LOC101849901 n=1 Tax=Aplysia californica TaxID=6500 RepID=A0ABM1AFT2_APLCA|nr:uncharacterized protein LOC101849901 [Aplysia californica]XP_012946797.1 uncharacterized protein LOC101849901 [Aplysia californica]